MSYEPTTWARGTKITAQKLNNIEQGVQSVNSEYTPTTWAEGDIVTATKLNNIEQGIANASGGGSSNLSVAEVTVIVNNGTGGLALDGGVRGQSEGFAFIYNDTLRTIMGAPANGTVTLNAVLIEGYAAFGVVTGTIISVSGNATLIDDGESIEITGNCTITANPTSPAE